MNLYFLVTLLGCFLGYALWGGASVASRFLQAAWPHKMEVEAVIL